MESKKKKIESIEDRTQRCGGVVVEEGMVLILIAEKGLF